MAARLGVTIPLISTSAVRTISMSVYNRSRKAYAAYLLRHHNIDVMKCIDTPGAYPSFASAAVVGAAGMGAGGTVSLIACKY